MIFIKNSEKGKVKTRLAATLGDKKALEIYGALLKKTKLETSSLSGVTKRVYYSNFQENDDIWSTDSFEKEVQHNGGLGERMIHAFEAGFKEGYDKICIIGSDCWDLESQRIEDAFNALDNHDFVVGPANDGGYYLLGMSYFLKDLFEGKEFSTDTVYKEAIDEIKKAGKTVRELGELIDIDTEEDLRNTALWHQILQEGK